MNNPNTKRFIFSFKSGYQGETDYIVSDRVTKKQFRASFQSSISEYHKNTYNGTKEEYERDVVGSLFYLTSYSDDISIETYPQLVKEFIDHLAKEHEDYIEWAKKQIVRIVGDKKLEAIFLVGPASPLVRGGAYWDNGWHRVDGTSPSELIR